MPLTREIVSALPRNCGIYHLITPEDVVIYVGSSDDLRRRVREHFAGRSKKARVMCQAASAIAIQECGSIADAREAELRDIQRLRPKYNFLGNFFHKYPAVQLDYAAIGGCLRLTLQYEPSNDCDLMTRVFVVTDRKGADTADTVARAQFGVYGANQLVKDAFIAWRQLLRLAFSSERAGAHTRTRTADRRRALSFTVRWVPAEWIEEISLFCRGASHRHLQSLTYQLVQTRRARAMSGVVQSAIDTLEEFYESECVRLARQLARRGMTGEFVPQTERDAIWLVM